ncbi:MAG: bifunctional 4-hydroxy-2-oxoglutarate aldolase/2-dehydro-3-deoxy-phosphogluconate aldolase [Chloroflexia bacterium]|nr:bifunctional 4-hydroxy-2-oxoglutarate aldolase/2-dehydro-3-deoxy-phosphogluconate aldolase [Chloroflexia bacterium]
MASAVERVEACGVVAIVRLKDYSAAVDLVKALFDGGIDVVEFTYTNPQAGAAIEEVKAALGDQVLAGAGTVLDPETCRAAILQGADFIVTPTVNVETVRLSRRYAIPTVIGAFTPTEILTAWEAGATFVKVFPARAVGPAYLKDVSGPLPQVRLIPTGGVSVENAGDFIRAGARAVALGGNLVDEQTVADRDWTTITSRSRAAVAAVNAARAS